MGCPNVKSKTNVNKNKVQTTEAPRGAVQYTIFSQQESINVQEQGEIGQGPYSKVGQA